jgi:hypothetical protein
MTSLMDDPYCEFRLTSSLTMTRMEAARLIPGLHLVAEVSDPWTKVKNSSIMIRFDSTF